MEKYLDYVLNNPKKVLIIIALLTILFGSGLTKLQFESSMDSIMPTQDPEYILNEEVKKIYGNNGKYIIMCVSADDTLTPDFLAKINDLHTDIEEYQYFSEEREAARIARLKDIKDKGVISAEEFISLFNDDSSFQRYLKRRIAERKNNSTIDEKFLSVIIKKFEQTVEIKRQSVIDLIISPFTMKDLIGKDDALTTYNIVEKDGLGKRIVPKNGEEIALLKKRLLHNPAFEGGIYVTDKRTGKMTDFGIMMRLKDSFVYDPIVIEFHDIAAGYRGQLDIILQGIPVIHHEINEYMRTDLERFLPLVFIVVMMVFYLNFRSARGVILPLITLTLADIWIVGLMSHLGFKLTVVGVSLPPLMIAVGSSYAIHILNQYYIDHDDITKAGLLNGLKSSMSHIILTVTLAGATTFIGFFTLVTNQVSSIREMGIFSAVGVLFAVMISITMIPAALILLPHKKPREGGGFLNKIKIVNRAVSLLAGWAVNRSRIVLAALAVILGFSLWGMSKVNVETSVLAYFKEGDYILTSSKLIGEKFGGSYGLNILIDSGKENGIKDPELLRFIDEFRKWMIADENIDLNIGRTDAFTDFIKTMHLAMFNNDFTYYKIPDDRKDIESYISIYSGKDDNDDGLADEFEPYVDRKFKTANLFVRIWEKQGELISSGIMDRIVTKIDNYLDKNLPKEYSYKTSGEPKVIVRLSKYVVSGQIMSLGFSLIIVGFVVFILFRNWRAGIIALIPISTAVIINFGIMGFLGLRLDLATAIIASITIGIGIDDTIHFLNTFRHFKTRKLSLEETTLKTLNAAGTAIVYTSLSLIFGFLILSVSNFKPIIFFGVLIAGTMIATTLGALLFLPAVINAFKIDLSPSKGNNLFWRIFNIGKIFKMDAD